MRFSRLDPTLGLSRNIVKARFYLVRQGRVRLLDVLIANLRNAHNIVIFSLLPIGRIYDGNYSMSLHR